jgi:hypothetical protein
MSYESKRTITCLVKYLLKCKEGRVAKRSVGCSFRRLLCDLRY